MADTPGVRAEARLATRRTVADPYRASATAAMHDEVVIGKTFTVGQVLASSPR